MSDARIEVMLAKQEIRDALSRYCRALDRMDREMAYAVWHPEGTAHYLEMYEGSGRGLVDWVWESHARMERHSHQISNVLVEVEGNLARSEAYVTVALWTLPEQDAVRTEIIGRGRYLDRWSLRGGRWAIDHRILVLDMQTVHTLAREGGPVSAAPFSAASARDASDPSFALFAMTPAP